MKENKQQFTKIILISGAPGTGKSTLAHQLANKSKQAKTVHIEVDDFWQNICKGYLHPWLDESGYQNDVVNQAVAASAECYAMGGYEVYVAGTIGPWFIQPWKELVKRGFDVRFIILLPSRQATIKRAKERQQRAEFPLDETIVGDVWSSLADLSEYNEHYLDTTFQNIDESVQAIESALEHHLFRLL